MTIKEFNEHNKNNTMPKEWIGQGYGYNDFINMVAELLPENTSAKDIDEVAYKVFETVDWQFPTSVVGEWHAWGWFDPTNDEYILKCD